MSTSEVANIVVLCDGTLNSPYVETNVYKLYRLLTSEKEKEIKTRRVSKNKSKPSAQEISIKKSKYYDDYYYEEGVGGIVDVIDALLATKLDEKIKNAYKHIVKRYNHKDNKSKRKEIWLSGFSRGAYTVRCVAGMIRNCGILRYDSDELIDRAYELYRSKEPNYDPNGQESENFRRSFSHPIDSTPIKFLGVWDTVGAHGIPTPTIRKRFEYLKLHDMNISNMVINAYQILSIHERVANFEPSRMFRKDEECEKCEECKKVEGECVKSIKTKFETKLEEVWFPGAHLEIGGGIYSIAQSISNESFLWMIKKIVYAGGLLSEERLEGECSEEERRLEKERLEKRFEEIKNYKVPKTRLIRLQQSILSRLPVFTLFRIVGHAPFLRRDRIIPLYRNDKNELTLDLLYNKGDWSKFKPKLLKKINGKKPNSLTNFYGTLEDILIEELKGGSEISKEAKDRQNFIDYNRKEIKKIFDDEKGNDDEIDKKIRENIRNLFDKVGVDKIDNIESFSALTISRLDIKRIKKKWDERI